MSQRRIRLSRPRYISRRQINDHLERIIACLRRIDVQNESDTDPDPRDRIAEQLNTSGIGAAVEVTFGRTCRADVMAELGVVIEVMRDPPSNPKRLLRKLQRAASQSQVIGVVVVTGQPTQTPPVLEGNPCRSVTMPALWDQTPEGRNAPVLDDDVGR